MAKKQIEIAALRHQKAKRLNIPTAELEPVMRDDEKTPKPVHYPVTSISTRNSSGGAKMSRIGLN
jgi:hypothetical protein